MTGIYRSILISLPILLSADTVMGQSRLALASGNAPASAATLPLLLTSAPTNQPAAIHWTFSYPGSAVSSLAVSPGPALQQAGKGLDCTGFGGSYTCIASGLNTNPIPDGVVAMVSVTLAGAAPAAIGVQNTM